MVTIREKAKELASRFWRIHPKEIQDMQPPIKREDFYAQEIEKLVTEAVKAEREACIEDLKFWGTVDETVEAIQKRSIS